jgi:hypothetical protein
MLSPEGLHPLSNLRDSLISSAYERQDTWSSRSEALKMFVKRGGTQKWDRRVLGLFVVRVLSFKVVLSPTRQGFGWLIQLW